MKSTASEEASSHPSTQEFPNLYNSKVHYRANKSLKIVSILKQN
jgi:hypothetical protein